MTVLLRRTVEELPSEGRPMSQKHGVAALYEQRRPLYEAWGEYAFDCVGVEETARAIKEALHL